VFSVSVAAKRPEQTSGYYGGFLRKSRRIVLGMSADAYQEGVSFVLAGFFLAHPAPSPRSVASAPAAACRPPRSNRAASTQGCREPAIQAKIAAGGEDRQERNDRDNRGLKDRDRTGPDNQSKGQRGAQQHDARLNVELHPKSGIQPAWNPDQISDQQTAEQRDQRRLDVVILRLVPRPDGEYEDRKDVDQDEPGVASMPCSSGAMVESVEQPWHTR